MSSPSDRCCAVEAVQHIVPFGSDPEIHMLTKPRSRQKFCWPMIIHRWLKIFAPCCSRSSRL
jgi:hypothetical protein